VNYSYARVPQQQQRLPPQVLDTPYRANAPNQIDNATEINALGRCQPTPITTSHVFKDLVGILYDDKNASELVENDVEDVYPSCSSVLRVANGIADCQATRILTTL